MLMQFWVVTKMSTKKETPDQSLSDIPMTTTIGLSKSTTSGKHGKMNDSLNGSQGQSLDEVPQLGLSDTSGVVGPGNSHENVGLDDPTLDDSFNSSLQEKHNQLQEKHISLLSENLATCEVDNKCLKL